MNRTSESLRAEIVAALPAHLAGRVAASGSDVDRWQVEIDKVVHRVDVDLAALLGMPFDRQSRTPLEVIRAAVAVLADELLAGGASPPEDALSSPEDPFGLAPVSAADLGEAALGAAQVWGMEKTLALSRPTVLVVTSNLMDGSRLDAAAASAGYRVETSRDGSSSTTPLVSFVDLELDGADDAIRNLAGRGVRVVAYGPHVDELSLQRATVLGALAAEPRSRIFRDPSRYLPPLV